MVLYTAAASDLHSASLATPIFGPPATLLGALAISGPAGTAAGNAGLQPVRVGSGVRAPTQISKVQPVYPAVALAARVQGIVILEATIGADGRVRDAQVLRSVPLLDQAGDLVFALTPADHGLSLLLC